MSAINHHSILKASLGIFFLVTSVCSFSQVSSNDSLNYFQMLQADSLFGNKSKGKIPGNFVLKNKDGKLLTNTDLDSKTTFVNFWFEGCHPCVAEFQALEKLYNRNKSRKDFQFISISLDPDSVIERVRKENRLTYPVYHLSQDSCWKMNFNSGFPTNWIVDKSRKVIYSFTGGSLDPNEADKFLNYFIQAELDKQLK